MNINNFIKAIVEQQEGFAFGEPWRHSEHGLAAVLPIVRETNLVRAYLTLPESTRVRIEDTGRISNLVIANDEEKPVLIRPGELFKGKTQERAAVVGCIIMPGERVNIQVVCVHQSRSISSGAAMESGGIAPSTVMHTLYLNHSQHAVWDSVQAYARMATFPTWANTDDLASQMKTHARVIADIVKAMPLKEHQVGMALLTLDGLKAIECFDLEESWGATRDDIILKEGTDLEKEDKTSAWEFKPEKAIEIVSGILNQDLKEETALEKPQTKTVKLSSKDFLGQVVLLEDKVVYLSLLKNV